MHRINTGQQAARCDDAAAVLGITFGELLAAVAYINGDADTFDPPRRCLPAAWFEAVA